MAGKVIDKDKGFKHVLRAVAGAAQKSHVAVGILQSEEKYEGSSFTVAEIAAVHEFGSSDGRIPPRPFIGGTYDEKLQENIKLVKSLQKEVLFGKRSKKEALTLLGEVVSKQMVSKINSRELVPNSPTTIRRKKSSTPLVDSGRLKGAISFMVNDQ